MEEYTGPVTVIKRTRSERRRLMGARNAETAIDLLAAARGHMAHVDVEDFNERVVARYNDVKEAGYDLIDAMADVLRGED